MAVILTQEEAAKIIEVLENALEFEECFKDEHLTEESCFHCKIERAIDILNGR